RSAGNGRDGRGGRRMNQVIRRGLTEIIVDEVPDPVVAMHHVLIRPHYSLISSGTETASIHRDGVLKELADNPSHLRTVWEAMKVAGPVRTAAEVKAKFSEYAVLGLGIVGQLIAQLVRLQGGIVIGVDLRPDRVELARRLGAAQAIGGSGSLRDVVSALTEGRGADCVIVAAAAKSPAPARQALEICRDRGRLVIVGAVELSFPWQEMYLKEIQLFMARAYGPGSYDPVYEREGRDYPVSYVRWTEHRHTVHFLRLLETGP